MKAHPYDKRDVFSFPIIRMSCLDSNIPSNVYYASIGSEILRFARTTSDENIFVTLSNPVLKRMHKQGSKYRSIIYMLNNNIYVE